MIYTYNTPKLWDYNRLISHGRFYKIENAIFALFSVNRLFNALIQRYNAII